MPKLETIANSMVIVAAGVFLFSFVRGELSKPRELNPGKSFALQSVNWRANQRTLVLALQEGCHYCSDSADLYRQLASEVNRCPASEHAIAVLPQPPDVARQYLDNLNIGIRDVRSASLESLSVRGTPTLVLVDANGKVVKAWVGKLSDDKATEVLQSMSCKAST
jgi:thioredoxin-related protein